MERYCSSMVHLLRGRELGFRNVLTGNVKTRCAKHKILQTCENIIGCNELFGDDVYSSLDTCYITSVISGSIKQKYVDFWTYTGDTVHLTHMMYMFNIVKENDDIYIEVRSFDGEVCMTIDAKKIIPKLNVSLEEWEKLKKIRNWGALIRETYGSIIGWVGSLSYSAERKLKYGTIENMWKERKGMKRGWYIYYVSYSEEFEPLILPRAAFKDEL